MSDIRWREEREEIIELLYRIKADHAGSLPERDVRRFGSWAPEAIKRAKRLRWVVLKGSPQSLEVTKKGSAMLDEAIAKRSVSVPQKWFGGSIVPVESEYGGPVLLPLTYEPYNELKTWATKQGVLTPQDIDRAANALRKADEEPREFRDYNEQIFPGTRGFAASFQYEDGHPLGGGLIDPVGSEGPYQVAATLTRRGAPDVVSMYMTDMYSMEGDSHLHLPEIEREDGMVATLLIVHTSHEGEETSFQLLANEQGRLGQIRTVLRAKSAEEARKTFHRLLHPFLCDLAFRYDIPVEILQTNIVEISTLTVSGIKNDDFREKVFDPDKFLGIGIDYRAGLPNYEFFTRLYREGVNSSSVDYGFLCFFRIAEGIIFLRRKRVAENEERSWKDVPRPDVFSDSEIVEGEEASNLFPKEFMGESLWSTYERLKNDRLKIGHAFMNEEDPLRMSIDIVADRLEGEEQAATRRAQARYLARRMLRSEFWDSDDEPN